MKDNQNFLDALNIASFIVGIVNYQENLTQNDKSEILQNSQNVSKTVIDEIDKHLQIQDYKIDIILSKLLEIEKILKDQGKSY